MEPERQPFLHDFSVAWLARLPPHRTRWSAQRAKDPGKGAASRICPDYHGDLFAAARSAEASVRHQCTPSRSRRTSVRRDR